MRDLHAVCLASHLSSRVHIILLTYPRFYPRVTFVVHCISDAGSLSIDAQLSCKIVRNFATCCLANLSLSLSLRLYLLITYLSLLLSARHFRRPLHSVMLVGWLSIGAQSNCKIVRIFRSSRWLAGAIFAAAAAAAAAGAARFGLVWVGSGWFGFLHSNCALQKGVREN